MEAIDPEPAGGGSSAAAGASKTPQTSTPRGASAVSRTAAAAEGLDISTASSTSRGT